MTATPAAPPPPTPAELLGAIRKVEAACAARVGALCLAAVASRQALGAADIAADAQILGGLDLAAAVLERALVGDAT